MLPDLEGPDRLQALLARTKAAYWLEDASTVTHLAQEADDLARQLKIPQLGAQVDAVRSHALAMQGDIRQGFPLAVRAAQAWPPSSPSPDLAYHLEVLGLFHYWSGDHRDAIPIMQSAYDLGVAVRSVDATIRAGASLALTLAGAGRHRSAFDLFERIVSQGREIEHAPRFTARALNMRAGVHRDLFEFDTARAYNQQAIELAAEASFHLAVMQGEIDLVASDLAEGRVPESADALQQLSERAAGISGFHGWLIAGRLLTAHAQLTLLAGDLDGATTAAATAIAHAQHVRRHKYEVTARSVLAAALTRQGRPHDAITQLVEAQRTARRVSHIPTLWRLAAAIRDARALIGDDAGAAAAEQETRQLASTFCNQLDPERAHRVLDAAQQHHRFP